MKIITLKLIFTAIIINLFNSIFESVQVAKPPNIKTIIFKINNNSSQFPILKKDSFIELSFDDLNASEEDYYYKISYYNYDWSDSILFKNECILKVLEITHYSLKLKSQMQLFSSNLIAF